MNKAERIRRLHVSQHIVIDVLGDSSKTILMSLWGSKSKMPCVFYNKFITDRGKELVCNIWDTQPGSVTHMFPSGSVDHTIIIYDLKYRSHNPGAKRFTLDDYLKQVQNQDRITVVIIYDKNKRDQQIKHITESIKLCKRRKIGQITISDDVCDVNSIVDLVKDISFDTFNERKMQITKKLTKIFEE